MMGIGTLEIVIIAAVALMVLGPEKFPDFARLVTRTFRDVRGYVQEAQRDLSRELKPVQKELDDLSRVDPKKYIENIAGDEDDKPANVEPEGPPDDPYSGEDWSYEEQGGVAKDGYGAVKYGESPKTEEKGDADSSKGEAEHKDEFPERLDG